MNPLIRLLSATALIALLSASLQAAVTPLVNHGDAWRYRRGTNAPQVDWKTATDAGLDVTWLTGNGGFGFGADAQETNNCQTIVTGMVNNHNTLYMRRTFTITSATATNLHLFLRMDWDDGYIAWLDGNYLTNGLSPGAPAEPPYSTNATALHECSTGQSGSTPQPAITNDLGVVGSRLNLGDHVLAIIGLNSSRSSGDFVQVADLFLDAVTAPPPITNGIGGTLTVDTTWYATNSPYNVTSSVTVASNVTLTIEPDVAVRFQQGTWMTINGRLLAEGTASQRITFTRAPGATTWERLMFVDAADSRLHHCVIEYANCVGDHKDYYPTACGPPPQFAPRNYHEAVVVLASHVDFDSCSFTNLPNAGASAEGDAMAVISDDQTHPGPASANVRNCAFIHIGQGVHTRYAYVLVENCSFQDKHGDNDDVDLYGESTPPCVVRNNLFLYPSYDDRIHPTRCSALIYGNTIYGSTDHGIVLRDVSAPVVFNNVLYNCSAGGISVQNGCEAFIANNTLVNCNNALKMFDHLDRITPPYCLANISGRATLINNIIWNSTPALNLAGNAFGTLYAEVSYSDIQGGTNNNSLGTKGRLVGGPGNINSDPMFVNSAVTNFHLRAGSPAIDAGTNLIALVTTDFDGLPRPLDGNGVGGAAFDIGAFEFLLATADSNGDGIPDGWCQQFGFSPVDPTVAGANPDSDPQTTYEEYIADTNPTNGLSYFHLEPIQASAPVSVQFLSSSNRQYTLLCTTNLTSTPPTLWTPVQGQENVPGTGIGMTLHDSSTAPQKFYKIGVRVP